MKIKSFTDLNTWKSGHELVLSIYKETSNFPREEFFGITNQLRRASVSVTSNIAEAYGRVSQKDKLRFYIIARGSVWEVRNQILVAKDVGYLNEKRYEELESVCIRTLKLLSGLIKYSSNSSE